MRQAALAAALGLLLFLPGNAGAAPLPEAAAGPQAGTAVVLTATVHLSNRGTAPSVVDLVVPLLAGAPTPYQTVVSRFFSPSPVTLQGTGAEQAARFQLTLAPSEKRALTQRSIIVSRAYQPPSSPPSLSPQEQARYLADEPTIEAAHPALRELAARLTGGVAAPEARAERLFAFVREHLRYDLSSPARGRGALAAYLAGSGTCTEFARLFVALARAAGVPSRIANGEVLLDRDGNPAAGPFVTVSRHEWAEYYDPSSGWVPVDPTLASGPDLFPTVPAYIWENEGDRPVTGTSRGGQVEARLSIRVEPFSGSLADHARPDLARP